MSSPDGETTGTELVGFSSEEEVARVVGWCAAEAPDAMNGSDVEVFG